MKKIWTPSIILLLLAGCNNAAPNSEEATAPFDEIATGLEAPWAINKTGDEFYISERAGTVAYIDEEGELTRRKSAFRTLFPAQPKPDFSALC